MNLKETPNASFENIAPAEGVVEGVVTEGGMEVASEKVSEVVGENASENIPQNKKKGQVQQVQSKGGLGRDTSLSGVHLVLPTPQKQKRELKKVITKRTSKLVREVTQLQKSKHYSPAKVEALIKEIRHLQEILSQLFNATAKKLESLYRQFVWKQ